MAISRPCDWSETCAALHLWTQFPAQFRLVRMPWVSRSKYATLYMRPGGLAAGLVHDVAATSTCASILSIIGS
ncbi:DUF5996 family protein [uncultured Aliiroseovarius sp.]|uniref:DUF5996 family protein n=1 Tax=uncultured Aliiroseovarius sp. TaxID=1658783 RepID=UPI00338DF248